MKLNNIRIDMFTAYKMNELAIQTLVNVILLLPYCLCMLLPVHVIKVSPLGSPWPT